MGEGLCGAGLGAWGHVAERAIEQSGAASASGKGAFRRPRVPDFRARGCKVQDTCRLHRKGRMKSALAYQVEQVGTDAKFHPAAASGIGKSGHADDGI